MTKPIQAMTLAINKGQKQNLLIQNNVYHWLKCGVVSVGIDFNEIEAFSEAKRNVNMKKRMSSCRLEGS
jgi:hypothetical protein